jgi:hypothetical protein
MRAFLTDLIGFFALCGALSSIAFLNYRHVVYDDDNYMMAAVDKHTRAVLAASPRLLIIGGSGVGFGIQSKTLAQELRCHPINLGYRGGQGIDYRLNEAQRYAQEGDVILLCPEYDELNGEITSTAVWRTFEAVPADCANFGLRTWKRFLDESLLYGSREAMIKYHKYLLGTLEPRTAPYSRSSHNHYGDNVGHYSLPQPESLKGRVLIELRLPEIHRSIRLISQFREEAAARGCKTLVCLPVIPASAYQRRKEDIDAIVSAFRADIGDILVNDIVDVAYDDRLFFDTHYHLNEEGARRRTHELIQQIGFAFQADPVSLDDRPRR